MKREVKGLFFIFVFVLTISLISASFSLGKPNHTIETIYAPGDSLNGWVNISFTDEPVNSLFETDNGGSISLIDLMMQNPGFQKTCIPSNCSNDYSSINPETTKSLTFDVNNQESLIGFKITGQNFEEISNNGFSLNIVSNAPESDLAQLSVDVLADGTVDWQSYSPSSTFQGKNYGCYVAPATGQADITQNPYCEKIHLDIAPNITIGAEVIDATAGDGTATFSLSIDDKEGNYASCEATATASGTIQCSPRSGKFAVREEKDYYVCLRTKSSTDNGDYKINYEHTDTCGYAGTESNPYDFEIFANPAKYAGLGTIVLNNSEMENYLGYSTNIESLISDYITNRYNNNCNSGCIIPIKIIGTTQSLSLSNAKLSYSVSGITTSENKLYDLAESNAKVTTSKYQKLNLDNANLLVPETLGKQKISLSFNSQNIFSENISIKQIPRIVSLTNNIVMAAYPALFTVDVNTFSDKINIVNYEWTFDDSTEITTENTVTHTFPSIGTYNLTVIVNDSNNATSSRHFTITAEVPKTAIALDLAEKSESIVKINDSLNSLPVFYRNSIKEILNLTKIEAQLEDIRTRNASASTDDEYVSIMTDLMKINVPKNISTTKKATNIPFYTKKDAVNLDALKDISSYTETIQNEDDYKNAVIAWNDDNIAMKINFDEISANYDEEDVPLLNFFDLTITKKQDLSYNSYLVISKTKNIKYAGDYSQTEEQNYDYIPLTQDETNVVFSTPEKVNFANLPAFITPKISDLSVSNLNVAGEENNSNNIWIIILLIGITLVIGFIVYLILQRWYANKYEDYLFKNKNDLYNLVSYIQTARRNGIGEGEIISRLKKAKWKSEQIRYVMRKGIGKNPGMFNIFGFKRRE